MQKCYMKNIVHKREVFSWILSIIGKMQIAIDGYSMEPVLRHHQLTNTFSYTNLSPGKCYLYKHGDAFITHRLVGFTKSDSGIFAGDNCQSFEIIPVQNILAVVDDFRSAKFHAAVYLLNRIVLFFSKHDNIIPFRIRRIRKKSITFLMYIDTLTEGVCNHGKKI
jgi:hypothetical protein